MTPPVSPAPATTTPNLGDFSTVRHFLQESICQRDTERQEARERQRAQHRRTQRSQYKDIPPGHRASPRYEQQRVFLDNSVRSSFSESRIANHGLALADDPRQSFKSSPPPSHGATQRIKSRTSSTIHYDFFQERHGSFGNAIVNYLNRLPDTPAPTPPPSHPGTLQDNAQTATHSLASPALSATTSSSSSAKKSAIPQYTILRPPAATSPPKKEKKKAPPAESSSGVSLTQTYPSRSPVRQPGADTHIVAPTSGSLPKSSQWRPYLHSLKKKDIAWASSVPSANRPLHVFVDMSNIIIGCYDACKAEMGMSRNQPFPTQPTFNFSAFNKVLCRGRKISRRDLAGSTSKPSHWPSYALDAKKAGYNVHILNRTVPDPSKTVSGSNPKVTLGGREQCVDELLHLKMAQSVLDEAEPGVMVLATGDANAAQFSDGFLMAVERALKRGWAVEVVSWSGTMSHAWTDEAWCSQWAGRFRTIELDPFLAKFVGQDILRTTSASQ
ncbi:hypothetical protein BROUX41_003548 [Berkeleyomyces rouxiae]|uniref:uncharacterized protein n=1 Tax=Berkeleyomyces rouxiae TaxID=2035830 RepID=UPI003B7DA5BD